MSQNIQRVHSRTIQLRRMARNQRQPRLIPGNQSGAVSPLVRVAEGANVAQASELESAKSAWFVASTVPMETLPWLPRTFLRWLWRRYKWAILRQDEQGKPIGMQAQTTCTTAELARELANKPGWFFIKTPINAPLGDEVVFYGEHDYPASSVSERDYKSQVKTYPLGAVEMRKLREADNKLDDLLTRDTRAL